jgi:hypothetical protein
MKQILNNTKSNLPTAWTKKKMVSLLLMGWLSVNRVKAGQAFKNCLFAYNNTSSYDELLNFPFSSDSVINEGKTLEVCCGQTQCLSSTNSTCPANVSTFFCNKIAQDVVCTSPVACFGIVGDTPITDNTTIGSCPTNLATIANYIENATQDNPTNNITGIGGGFAH